MKELIGEMPNGKLLFEPEWSDWVFERLTDSTSWFRKGILSLCAAILITGIVMLVIFLTMGMDNTLYGLLGLVLTGIGGITVGLLMYITWDYKKFNAKLHSE